MTENLPEKTKQAAPGVAGNMSKVLSWVRRSGPFLISLVFAVAKPVCAQVPSPTSGKLKALVEPQMAGPLVTNPQPASVETESVGHIYFTGALSGLGLAQTHPIPADRSAQLDVGNAQIMLQKPEGLVQFYAQAGMYSIPVVGFPYIRASQNTRDLYGPLPVVYVKLAPHDDFSIQVGKLQTLIGPEPTFTFQNMNIQRGLLWNQEPAVSRGVQADYAAGPLNLSISVNDGFYSGHYSWLVAAATWKIDDNDSLTFLASGNARTTRVNTFATPVALNNGQIYNLVYTHAVAPWKITSYFQVVNVPANGELDLRSGAQSYGGAMLASYQFTSNFQLTGRVEVVGSTGSAGNGAADLLYGPGSAAWTLTLTPTYQEGRFYIRAEPSFTQARNVAPGRGFGNVSNARGQARFIVETGILF